MAVKNCIECNKQIAKSTSKCIHCGGNQLSISKQIGSGLLFILIIFGLFYVSYLVLDRHPVLVNNPVTSAINNIVDDNNTTISKSEFDQLQLGIDYNDAVKIIGCAGSVLSESSVPGSNDKIILYSWKGHGSLGANANAMFSKDKLVNKAQFGLE